jgi:hypothetical protein
MNKHPEKRASIKELKDTLKFWQQRMKLSDWSIKIRYATLSEIASSDTFGDNTLGQLDCCWYNEKVAVISIHPEYHKADGFDTVWTLATLILHELIHIHLYEKSSKLPVQSQDSPRVWDFEEYICDSLAKIIYDCTIYNH